MTDETPKQDNRIHYLYRITNTRNGKIYIGQSVDTVRRWYEHKREASHENPGMVIARAIKKYGNDAFEFEVIASCKDWEDANDTETELVRQYSSQVPNGYNVAPGGINAPKSEAFRQMMRDHWADPEYKAKVVEAISQAYAQRTPEEKEQTSKLLSELLSGRHLSPETEYRIGHSFDETTLQKMSEIKEGKHISPDTEFKPEHQIKWNPTPEEKENWIEQLSAASKGKHRSPATEIKPGQRISIATEFKPTINWPSDQELIELINQNGMAAVARMLGVKLTNVSKRLTSHGIRNKLTN